MSIAAHSGLDALSFSPAAEEWVEFGPPGARRRIGFHDYGAIYAVPGLYEAMFHERLGMRSTTEVVGLYGDVLAREGLNPGAERVVDFGAGNGHGGVRLRQLGVGHLCGVDLEPMARIAADRDHPGVYDEYLVGDVARWDESELGRLTSPAPTALLALSAIGIGHVLPSVLDRVIGCLPNGGIYGFGLNPRLLPGTKDPEGLASGFPDYISALLERSDLLAESAYVHRVRPDGSDDLAVAFIGRVRRPEADLPHAVSGTLTPNGSPHAKEIPR